MAEADLARFIDARTVEYMRVYPHPIERVWRAITDPAEFGVWFIRGAVELRPGGAYRFESGDWTGEVLQLDAPRLIRFGFQGVSVEDGWFQYELDEAPGGTRMRFTSRYFEGVNPGSLGGWHAFWDGLGDFLDGAPIGSRLPTTPEGDLFASWARKMETSGVYTAKQAARAVRSFRDHQRWLELTDAYAAHIEANVPPYQRATED